MISVTSKQQQLSTIDLLFKIVETPERTSDFALVLQLKHSPSLESLRLGARSARNLFPTSGSYLDGKLWQRLNSLEDGIEAVSLPKDIQINKTIEEFLKPRMDLRHQPPVHQLAISHADEIQLVTRFHHTAADGFSAALWLHHQISVATGLLPATSEEVPYQQPLLRKHSSPVKQSKFAPGGPSNMLLTTKHSHGHVRRWQSFDVPSADLQARAARNGFSYSDLLATCTLEVFAEWNRRAGHDQRIGLWLPVNVRQKGAVGFGNGTSRIRVHRRYSSDASLSEKCKEVRRQIRWALRHGEWAVPSEPLLTRLPLSLGGPILRAYLNRPGVDMATGVFTHVDKWSNRGCPAFDLVYKIESVGQLHKRHRLAIHSVTLREHTWFTFTYDATRLTTADVEELCEMYRAQLVTAQRELT
jgi:hypothetical protein